MSWESALEAVQKQVREMTGRLGVSDAEVGAGMHAVVRGQQPDPAFERAADRDILARAAWWLFVRAPALHPDYVVLAPMTLDLLVTDQRTLRDVFEDLTALEQAVADGTHTQRELEPALVESLAPFQKHAQVVGRIPKLRGRELRKHLHSPLRVLADEPEVFQTLNRIVMEALLGEFDAAARGGAFRGMFAGEAGETSVEGEAGVRALVQQAQEAFEAGELEASLDAYASALALDADAVDAYVGRGGVRAALGDLEGAIGDLGEALERMPEHLGALIDRGLMRQGAGDLDGALADLTRATEVAPKRMEPWLNRAHLLAARGELDRARADARQAIKLDPEHPIPYTTRGTLWRYAGNTEQALRDYERALERDPEHVEAYAGRGYVHLLLGEHEEAEEDFSEAIQLHPYNPAFYYNRSVARAALGELEGVIEDLDEAIALDDEDVQSFINRGVAHMKREDVGLALADWDRAMQLDPYHPVPYAKRGSLFWLSGELNAAEADLRRALELAPEAWPFRDTVEAQLDDVLERIASGQGG